MAMNNRNDELNITLANKTDEKGRIDAMLEMAERVKNFDVDYALQIAEDVIQRARSLVFPQRLGTGLCLKGFCLRLKGEYNSGISVLQEALAIALKLKNRNLEATTLYYLGNIYRDLGDLANVLVHYEKALEINEELGDEYYQSVILSSISNLLYDLNEYDSALEYAVKCLPIFERVGNINNILNVYNTLGNIYFKKERHAEALHYFEENMNRSEPQTAAYVMAESGLGKVYFKMHDFDNARKHLINSLQESTVLALAEVEIICNYYLGRLYMDEGNYRQAFINLNAAYNKASEYLRKQDIMSIHETLSDLYDKMGDVPKAFHHIKMFLQLKEEIFQQTIINELRNLQVRQQIELAKKEKEVAERTAFLKHQFMANMSHEIRTPLNAIVGMTRLLLSKNPLPEQLKYLNAIQMSSDNLLVIINDILDLSKIEAGKIIIEQTDFSIVDTVRGVSEMLMLKAEEKRIKLNVNISDQVPARLCGDPTRIGQVLTNLAGNAVKFTGQGFVEIKVYLHEKKDNQNWVAFDIIDTGIGISPEYIETIFDSFTQAGTDVTRKFGGTGLGLAISKQLVNLMGGDISVKSELGKGTTFTCIIPMKEAATQTLAQQTVTISDASFHKMNHLRILIVEDNEFNRMVAEDTLHELLPNAKIGIAVNGEEAVETIKTCTYDLVLMDIQMPVMDGLTATKLIRTKLPVPAKDVKIIAMTANVLQEDVKTYSEIGMDGIISKPFQPEELLSKIETVMNTDRQIPTLQAESTKDREQAEPELPALPAVITDRNFLKTFSGGNIEKERKYIGMFLENAPKLLAKIDNALAAKDFAALKIAAHSLKPQMSYMGIKEEVSKIFLLEQSAGQPAHFDTIPFLVQNLKNVCAKSFIELAL
jgi:signal transduction histidine kinase/CheY-like chemotaxis protein/HPt (histidine-containing phosphotransfer) domain-containing protein